LKKKIQEMTSYPLTVLGKKRGGTRKPQKHKGKVKGLEGLLLKAERSNTVN